MDLKEIVEFEWYRFQERRRGVSIDRRARILAQSGIHYGRGIAINAYATVAANHLQHFSHLGSEPQGSVSIGDDVVIHQGAILSAAGGRIDIGPGVSINPYSILYGHGGLSVGASTRIASHCTIVSANHVFADSKVPICEQGIQAKGVKIGEDVWMGTHSTVLDGVKVSNGCVIAAGSVVTKDTAPFGVYAGVPAKRIKERNGCAYSEGSSVSAD